MCRKGFLTVGPKKKKLRKERRMEEGKEKEAEGKKEKEKDQQSRSTNKSPREQQDKKRRRIEKEEGKGKSIPDITSEELAESKQVAAQLTPVLSDIETRGLEVGKSGYLFLQTLLVTLITLEPTLF